LDGKAQRPTDIASERGFDHIAELLEPPPDLIPQISYADLLKIQEHFLELVIEESRGMFKPDEMRVVDLTVLREVKKAFMPVPGMYGVSMSSCCIGLWIDFDCFSGVQCTV
jgi:hypothetical protein